MKDPTFLLQAGDIMTAEKTACCFSNIPVRYCKFEDLGNLDKEESRFKFVPVGSVEFTKEYANCTGLKLPEESISYLHNMEKYLKRRVERKKFKDAEPGEFVKPYSVKSFTGDIKMFLKGADTVDPECEVWSCAHVPFESEFRFYVHDFVSGPKILGWARYDDEPVTNPEPNVGMVEEIAWDLHNDLGPSSYSIDIGWRPDLKEYCLVELNDGWSLGYYTSTDPQSNPPTRQDYADMLVSRWTQILFCNLV